MMALQQRMFTFIFCIQLLAKHQAMSRLWDFAENHLSCEGQIEPKFTPCPPQDEELLYFVHTMKSGGTELSCLLTNAVEPGEIVPISRISKHTDFEYKWKHETCEDMQRYKFMYGHPWSDDFCALRHMKKRMGRNVSFILVVRDPYAHRMSWFREKKYQRNKETRDDDFKNMTSWFASKNYREHHNQQLEALSLALYGATFKALDISGAKFAKEIIDDPRVKFIMTTESFSTVGLCRLHKVLNITFPHPNSRRMGHPKFTLTDEAVTLMGEFDTAEILFYQVLQQHVVSQFAQDPCYASPVDEEKTLEKYPVHTNIDEFSRAVCSNVSHHI